MEMMSMNEEIRDLASKIEEYAKEKQLTRTACALPLVLGVLLRSSTERAHYKEAAELQLDARHALSTCRMLIDLHPGLDTHDEDVLLATDLCRILPQYKKMDNIEEELASLYHLDPEICHNVSIVHRRLDFTEEQFKNRIRNVQENKLALMIVLASRGNIIEHLTELSFWNARAYIQETRRYYFPMCIYGKEHYPDILPVLNILFEKVKSLVDAAEILFNRYEEREFELMSEIISLQEENVLLKEMLCSLKENK